MTTLYSCKKCSFKTNNYLDLKRHINKKKICIKNLESFTNSDDQLLITSLLPNSEYNNIKNQIDYLKKSDDIYKNKIDLLYDLDFIDKNKIKSCIYCNEKFTKIIHLRKHLLIECFYKNLIKKGKIKNVINIDIVENNQNIFNNCILENITNVTNIYFSTKTPLPFDKEWDISKIDIDKRSSLMISKIMYTKFLEEILKNEINLNVIIDKNNESGIVYKNDIDKYIEMKSKDIVDNTMIKLKKQLLDMSDDCKDSCFNECLDFSKKIIEKKHIDYLKDKETNTLVKDFISNIFENKKEDAIVMSNNIKNSICDFKKGF